MSKENITLDYRAVSYLVSQINNSDLLQMQELAADYHSTTTGMDKSAGEMLEAIKAQVEMEAELVDVISEAYRQLAGSIGIAAQSLQNIDAVMTTQME